MAVLEAWGGGGGVDESGWLSLQQSAGEEATFSNKTGSLSQQPNSPPPPPRPHPPSPVAVQHNPQATTSLIIASASEEQAAAAAGVPLFLLLLIIIIVIATAVYLYNQHRSPELTSQTAPPYLFSSSIAPLRLQCLYKAYMCTTYTHQYMHKNTHIIYVICIYQSIYLYPTSIMLFG